MSLCNWQDRFRHLHRTSVRLDKLSQVPYALLVRSWSVTFRRRGFSGCLPGAENMQPFDTLNERVVSIFSATLRLYQNLSSLQLMHVTVDGCLRQTLALLLRLDDLGLCNWDIVVPDGFLPLRRLSLSGPGPTDTTGPVQIGCPGTLRTLHAGDYISRLILGFGPHTLNQLIDLALVTVENVDLFFRFLGQCPQLECLAVRVLDNPAALPLPTDAKIIPHLRTLAGPPNVHYLLTSGRPISTATVLPDTSVGVAPPQELIHVCFAIARSSVPICSLNLMPKEAVNLEFLAAIATLFPELSELSLTLPETTGSDIFFLNMCYGPRRGPPVGLEWPDLDDDAAFDNITVDDISDDEVEESPTIVAVKSGKPETHQADSTAPPAAQLCSRHL
ncbi:hypothetical protein B0H14DRAFT_3148504 [Mycena olivaceomarginata]|nr:hypothetical protein B0H14DRAFT_3148504 [Mycena olivaceomarginata]